MAIQLHNVFNRAQIGDRQVNELIGLAHGLLADGKIDQSETEYLQKWLVTNTASHSNPIISNLLDRVNEILSDGIVDDDEAQELFDTLQRFAGGDFEIGELQKSSALPLNQPPPDIFFDGQKFCFTGTFAFGSRKACEAAVKDLKAEVGSLTSKTNYLVIGVYATDSWAHSSYGRKIEKAVEMQAKGNGVQIIGEEHWLSFLN